MGCLNCFAMNQLHTLSSTLCDIYIYIYIYGKEQWKHDSYPPSNHVI